MLPEIIKTSELWGPLFALTIFILVLILAITTQVILQLLIRKRRKISENSIDLEILEAIKGPLVLFFIILAPILGFIILTRIEAELWINLAGLDIWAKKLWTLIIIFEISYVASKISQVLMQWYVKKLSTSETTKLETKLLPPIKRILPITIYAVATLIALDQLNIAISPLLAGFGIGGLAVALAVQPTLSNFFAGTYLVSEGQLKEGDFIELEGGPSGYIEEVGWRSTKIKNRFNNLVIIPNSKMIDSILTNYYSPTPATNVIVTCGISYESDLNHVEKIVNNVAKEIINSSDEAVKDADPFVGFSEFGDSNIEFFVFLQAKDRIGSFKLKSELIKSIYEEFANENIEINYPVRKIKYDIQDKITKHNDKS
ncbi:MAG: mechanosensitive ion channel family protein [SAR202 cluster bacterium]|jgi:small-conductance mechanosensitive channel|nr:mechanosensitive ion channel family protein [SAR202 cluster bacterium]